MTAPAVVTVTVVSKVMNSDGICAGIRLVARSRSAQNTTDTSANSENWLKPASPGRTMMSTPMKPATIADQRRQPTGSPNITRGAERDRQRQRLKDRRGIGERQMRERGQERDRAADLAEHPQRDRLYASACAAAAARPDDQANAATSTIANSPRTSITWPKFISDDTALVMVSFIVNAAMARP